MAPMIMPMRAFPLFLSLTPRLPEPLVEFLSRLSALAASTPDPFCGDLVIKNPVDPLVIGGGVFLTLGGEVARLPGVEDRESNTELIRVGIYIRWVESER